MDILRTHQSLSRGSLSGDDGCGSLPPVLAFGIASGAGAAAGLYAAIFAGFVALLCGGSEVQVSGPTGARTVILVGIINEHGIAGMLAAGAIAGLLQLMIGFMG